MLGSFNTPRRVLLKESDYLPQVGPTQTSQAAKLIPDSTCLAQDLKIQLGRSFFLFLSAAAVLLSGGPCSLSIRSAQSQQGNVAKHLNLMERKYILRIKCMKSYVSWLLLMT